jgi:hypothetical protein
VPFQLTCQYNQISYDFLPSRKSGEEDKYRLKEKVVNQLYFQLSSFSFLLVFKMLPPHQSQYKAQGRKGSKGARHTTHDAGKAGNNGTTAQGRKGARAQLHRAQGAGLRAKRQEINIK